MDAHEKYLRIGIAYYQIVEKPLISGDTVQTRIRWNRETIVSDHGKSYLSSIDKFKGLVCIPDHLNYRQTIGDFYNTYHPLPHSPIEMPNSSEELETLIPRTMEFLKHIFGEQYRLGLDYLKILYEKPTQILPVLCLVSKERSTGKSTFIKWMKQIFGSNMTYIKGDSFASQFNSDWASALLIAIDEVFFDRKEITERLKYLSTTDKDKVEQKGKDREEIEFFGKFILCSNNETDFIQIDSNEIRFWVRKINPIKSENFRFLDELKKEIPYFLKYLILIPYYTPNKSRMWFSTEEIRTKALIKLMKTQDNYLEGQLIELFYEIFDSTNDDEIKFAPKEIQVILNKQKRGYFTPNEIRKVVKNDWSLMPVSNSLRYEGYELTSYGEFVKIDRIGRYFTVKRKNILEKFDDLMSS